MNPFCLPAVLTHAEASATAHALVAAVQAQPKLQVDASALQQFDSSALAVLLAGMREALVRGGRLQVQGLPARARSLVQVYGLTEVLQLPPVPA
jgi:phospholipid transport system transporter-binding protein